MNLIPEYRFIAVLPLTLLHRGAAVFMLHRVLPPDAISYDPELVTSTELFDSFVRWLTTEFDIVTLGEIAERIQHGKPVRRLCAITFDDGWLDNYTYAFPILCQAGVTATMFVASGYIGSTRRLWQEKLWYLLARNPDIETFATEWSSQQGIPLLGGGGRDFAAWRAVLLNLGSQRAEDFVSKLESVTPSGIPPHRAFMSWDEIREMSRAGVEFGAHTVNHVFLPTLTLDDVHSELVESRNAIRTEIGTSVSGFAYPWGAMNGAIRDCVIQAGFEYAAGVQSGIMRAGEDNYLVPRIFISTSVLATCHGFSATQTSFYLASSSLARARKSQGY